MGFSQKAARLGFVVAALAAGHARGGVFNNFTFTDDGTSGISPSNTYTAKADPGAAEAATVNGVVFDTGTLTGAGADTVYSAPGMTYSIAPGGVGPLSGHPGNADVGVAAGSGVATLLTDMVYTANALGQGNTTILTFTGLNPGTQYSARIYYRAWDASVPRPSTIVFDEDGGGPISVPAGSVDEDLLPNVGRVLGYDYTAVSDGAGGAHPLIVRLTADTANNSWHLYGVTNQVVPEPASLGFLGLGAVTLLARRRRAAAGAFS